MDYINLVFTPSDFGTGLLAIFLFGVRVFHVLDQVVEVVLNQIIAEDLGNSAGSEEWFAFLNLSSFVVFFFLSSPGFSILADVLADNALEGIGDTVEDQLQLLTLHTLDITPKTYRTDDGSGNSDESKENEELHFYFSMRRVIVKTSWTFLFLSTSSLSDHKKAYPGTR